MPLSSGAAHVRLTSPLVYTVTIRSVGALRYGSGTGVGVGSGVGVGVGSGVGVGVGSGVGVGVGCGVGVHVAEGVPGASSAEKLLIM